ncbi:hypothetical protein PAXINDRAFT_166726 [Paxillus involutus ATCC 200175]|nr:hypothetical protein PAXINDRAFT_166726 [Paxillus involutus ATCC 200175]
MAPVSTQPIPSLMNVYTVSSFGDEKHPQQCQVHYDSEQPCGCADSSSHRACHKARLRKMLLPVALSLLAVGAMLVISCATDINLLDLIGLGGDSGSVLGKRQTSSSSSFTNNKLYLIIIFVGLLLVLVAGVMLSFWCCKGSFENPLCCPCYLCACCGGLACLECIGCGLCAAGLDEAL